MIAHAFDIGSALKITETKRISSLGTISDLISNLLPNLYLLAGIVLFFLLIFSGLQFIIYAGQDDPERTAKAKKAMTAAIIGFIFVFGSYWLIQIVEVLTGVGIFAPRGFGSYF